MKYTEQANYLNVFGTNFRLKFFNISTLEAKDLNKRFPIKECKETIDFKINFYNIEDNNSFIDKFNSLADDENNIVLDQKGFIKSDFATSIYEASEKKVSCFYRKVGNLSSLVISLVKNTFYFSQGKLNILFLHSAGISANDNGYVFIAPSQGGKSTIASLAEKANLDVLSDELLLIKEDKGDFYLYQFPLEHSFNKNMEFVVKNRGHKLKNLFFLEKASEINIKNISLVKALAKAYSQSTSFFIDLVPEEQLQSHRTYVMGFLERLLKKIPHQELSFNKSDPVFEMLGLEN